MLCDLREVFHADDEWYEQAPSLNQELEEKITSTQSWMVAHVSEGARGSAPAAREGCGHAGWRQETPCLYLRQIIIYLFLLLLVGVRSPLFTISLNFDVSPSASSRYTLKSIGESTPP